ncbi:MAG: SPOR domain-containing protein [gamma proteobacterium symbiont of Bathyaustriella thionipta]|nr:SPOR domain-containing protein [gamma proteobacterium symbiont of Bathyaustriella thionipta]MCU7950387.1 SPOR domain-containing protein [gamma proteobacterium symbiont of Bathyaustriella thionipta]MCU7953502.1 SPOR domain-containing protein [gamma proteobacterium symbiont of Bathyaustriella thionipta]MCU7956899.1 SPOR domain-containing protein [gamma proteobacterium symbiont of Bathyaustriella thionipta]MCU7966781.1 SPOR domain-containing protein [gamma proteobacterium symbiont of Bathyaustr
MPVKKRSKKKSGATRNQEQGSSSWSWIVIGILVGGFVIFLVYLDKIPTEGENQAESNQVQKKQASQTDKKPQQARHQFDFYTVLPDREVKVDNASDEKQRKKVTPKAPKPTAQVVTNKQNSTSLYQLQVGAFKELTKADAMKARLAFIGVESNIQVIYSNGQKMYRVRVGPSTDEQKINHIKKQLKAQNINTFVQKLSG